MKVSIKDNTEQKHLILSDIPDRLYIDSHLWVSTSYGVVKIGIENGPIYELRDKKLVEIK